MRLRWSGPPITRIDLRATLDCSETPPPGPAPCNRTRPTSRPSNRERSAAFSPLLRWLSRHFPFGQLRCALLVHLNSTNARFSPTRHPNLGRNLRRLPRENDPVTHLCNPPQLTEEFVTITDLRVLFQASQHDGFFSSQLDGHLAGTVADAALVGLGHIGTVAG